MDLIFTNAAKEDLGVLEAYAFDLSFGVDENDFEITVSKDTIIESGAVVYIEGTEYGGIVDGLKTDTTSETITYFGRTWHGILNSKVIEPDNGADYLVVSGDANTVLASLIDRLGLSDLFSAFEAASGVNISGHQFNRYCLAYDGIRAMLSNAEAKMKITWKNRGVVLSVEPITDYTKAPVDGDMAALNVERHDTKVNHLVCLGRGELAEREVIHLYADNQGRIVDTQYYSGVDEVMAVYDYSNVESSDELRSGGIAKLKELRDNSKAEASVLENDILEYDIGDIVGATDMFTGVSVSAPVSQKIVRINDGVISTEYKIGEGD